MKEELILVVNAVVERFEKESYGFTIGHSELKELMGVSPARTIEESKKEQFVYMMAVEKVKKWLLRDYNLCLFSAHGEGYKVLHPSEQITKAADHYVRKSQAALSKTMRTLANVDVDVLSQEEIALRHEKINRAAFIKAAFRKRRHKTP